MKRLPPQQPGAAACELRFHHPDCLSAALPGCRAGRVSSAAAECGRNLGFRLPGRPAKPAGASSWYGFRSNAGLFPAGPAAWREPAAALLFARPNAGRVLAERARTNPRRARISPDTYVLDRGCGFLLDGDRAPASGAIGAAGRRFLGQPGAGGSTRLLPCAFCLFRCPNGFLAVVLSWRDESVRHTATGWKPEQTRLLRSYAVPPYLPSTPGVFDTTGHRRRVFCLFKRPMNSWSRFHHSGMKSQNGGASSAK